MPEKTDKTNKLDIVNPELEAQKEKEAKDKVEREEQERTTRNKKLFLEAFSASMGIITAACQKASISRTTYYEWIDEDPDFKAAVDKVNDQLIDYSEDKLKQKIVGGNLKAVLFHLSRISPKYRQKIENFIKDQRTLEDLFDEAKAEQERQPKVVCPKCGKEYDDFDGIEVLYCEVCGFCKHASMTGGICDFCKKTEAQLKEEKDVAKPEQSSDNGSPAVDQGQAKADDQVQS